MNRTKYTRELLEPLVAESLCVRDVMRKLNIKLTGGGHAHIKNIIKKHGLSTDHFLGQAFHCGQKTHRNKLHWTEVLVLRQDSDRRQHANILRRALVESGREYACSDCGNKGEWCGKPLTLEVDHKNNNWLDDRAENLDFVCPNCHSQRTDIRRGGGILVDTTI